MVKRHRNYVLTVQDNVLVGQGSPFVSSDSIEIKPPFTLEFDITKNTLISVRFAQIRIYNLSENNRARIRRDRYAFGVITGSVQRITLRAGYGDNMPVIFDGNIQHAWSVREGNNVITTIEAGEGLLAYLNSNTQETFRSGTTYDTMIRTLMNSLSPFGVGFGAIGNYEGSIQRGYAASGNTVSLLQELTGGGFFVNNSKGYSLRDNDTIVGALDVIDSSSGLLGTPVREATFISFPMLFEPRLLTSQFVRLKSDTATNLNGDYKVVSIHHKGVISEAICGAATTEVGLSYGLGNLQLVGV